ncbi:hypothetical protein OBBRIDRAFT_773857 [Obba rivulosa]|uniref:Uncharacterized protein n=1 Tax=Obba rivulosa TaxID=1052685 RepID=A0A8E2DL47_9APHY|nr:hypothetical protein OBBRIDRAFT_773857 [Obba rivulosa]
MVRKRKIAEVDLSEDEEPSLGKQVLPVANLPADFTGEPTDGLQYLFMVRRDARLLPRITRVTNPYEVQPEPAPTIDASTSRGTHSPLPSDEWRETFLRRFRNFRKNALQPTLDVQTPRTEGKILPDKKDRDCWWAFIAGRPQAEWDPPKKPKQHKVDKWQKNARYSTGTQIFAPGDSVAGLSYEVQPHPAIHEETRQLNEEGEVELDVAHSAGSPPILTDGTRHDEFQTSPADTGQAVHGDTEPPVYKLREPTPFLMRSIDHRYALHLLMYFTHWMNLQLEEGSLPFAPLTATHARWMFVLLSRVDDYLSGDEMSLLRSLARACMSILKERLRGPDSEASSKVVAREVLSSEPMDAGSCWMIITVVAGIWGQKDLWMDIEAMLT